MATEYTKENKNRARDATEERGLRCVSGPFVIDVRWWGKNKKKHTWAGDLSCLEPLPSSLSIALLIYVGAGFISPFFAVRGAMAVIMSME